jgi:hypothetical protein
MGLRIPLLAHTVSASLNAYALLEGFGFDPRPPPWVAHESVTPTALSGSRPQNLRLCRRIVILQTVFSVTFLSSSKYLDHRIEKKHGVESNSDIKGTYT